MADLPLTEVASVTVESADGGTKMLVNSDGSTNDRTLDGVGNSVTSTTVGAKQGLDVSLIQAVPDISVSGASTALNQTLTATAVGGETTWTVSLRPTTVGSWTAGTTIVFEASVDGVNYSNIYGSQLDASGGTPNNGVTGPNSAIFQGSMAGVVSFRTRVNALSAGDSVTIVIKLSVEAAVVALRLGLPAGSNVIGHVVVDSAPTTAITVASLPLPTGAATDASLTNGNLRGIISTTPSTLWVTGTAATGVALTITLPAVAAQFHYINSIEIEAYSTAARTGGATPVLVTTTDLPGSPVWTFATAAAIGTTDTKVFQFSSPVKSSTVNTATTIVCPATTGIIWRVNVSYLAAA